VRTGFGEILNVEDHEVIISHDAASVTLQVYSNSSIGETDWVELSGSDDITGLWPSTYCPAGTDDIYVVNANSSIPTALYFSRSDDGGETWSVLNSTVPFLTPDDGISFLTANVYQVCSARIKCLYSVWAFCN
jgi:hypothetical protein